MIDAPQVYSAGFSYGFLGEDGTFCLFDIQESSLTLN
jgi:hypothetical protein